MRSKSCVAGRGLRHDIASDRRHRGRNRFVGTWAEQSRNRGGQDRDDERWADAWFVGYTPTLATRLVWSPDSATAKPTELTGARGGASHLGRFHAGGPGCLPAAVVRCARRRDDREDPTRPTVGAANLFLSRSRGVSRDLSGPALGPARAKSTGGVVAPVLNLWRRFSDWFAKMSCRPRHGESRRGCRALSRLPSTTGPQRFEPNSVNTCKLLIARTFRGLTDASIGAFLNAAADRQHQPGEVKQPETRRESCDLSDLPSPRGRVRKKCSARQTSIS